jgi:acyl carrier protein
VIVESLRDRLLGVVSSVLGVPTTGVDGATSPQTVATWDSLGHLNLVVALESEFGVSLTPEQVFEMNSVDAIATVLRAHGVEI